ncbi:MAG: hypothetical protein JSV50_06995 [Desulfobacteraceae bacterium]|nr:MAG: hypothetical protein JSV50_06995 [Desulfobacteraceae bacterium]
MRIDRGIRNIPEKDRGAKQAKRASITGAMEHNQKKHFLDMTALIRSIQRAEGNVDCFQREQTNCDQVDCAWHSYCLEDNNTS